MRSSWKIKVFAILAASCVWGWGMPGVQAADTLLASTELRLAQGSAAAELWGDRLPNGYARDLLVLVKDKDKLLTAYKPSIKGGYHCLLQPVQIKPADNNHKAQLPQQLLISAGQGDWAAGTEYRVLDFAEPAQVQELFSAADSMGIVTKAEVQGADLRLEFIDGQKNTAQLAVKADDGKIAYGGLYSLTAYDLDGDGQQELLTAQQLRQGQQLLADVGAVWQLQNTKENNEQKPYWKQSSMTVMTLAEADKGNTINDGKEIPGGAVLPRKIVVPGGEATYPVAVAQDVQLQNTLNRLLGKECQPYLSSFYKGEADMAFKVLRADELLLTIQLISGKGSFRHQHINIDPSTGKMLQMEDILEVNNPELRALLEVLCTNKAMMLHEGIPRQWYIEGNNLFLVQNICGKDEAAGFALGNLHKYLLDKKWLGKNN